MAFLKIENYRKSFGSTEVLKGVSFELEKGQVLAIIGSSGGGKTTLLRCINFLETADEGRLYLNGELLFDAGEEKSAARATRISAKSACTSASCSSSSTFSLNTACSAT